MIEVKDLSVKYGGVTSLDGMNLRFEEGVCGLIGPNGAGKTTFFNVRLRAAGVWRGDRVR
jgi:branched-chain amino acid transport system ATP-binding protein